MTKLERLFRGLALVASVASASAGAQVFSNNSVVALHEAGLGDDAIIAKVDALPCNYDLSTNSLISLKRSKVSDQVIVAMVNRCAGSNRAQGADNTVSSTTSSHSPGIYIEQHTPTASELVILHPAGAAGAKTTGNGSVLFPFQIKLIVPQPTAQLHCSERRPVFWFYFNQADRKVDTFGTSVSVAAQSPNEFSLVRFRQDHGNRQFVVGRAQAYVQVSGVDPKNTIPFSIKEVGDGAFKIEMTADLAAGEYAFVLPGERNHFRIYDFSISS